MPEWTTHIPKDEISNTYRLMRTPATARLVARITSSAIIGCPVHWYGGRTVPHEAASECVPCEHGRSYRWVAYLACVAEPNNEHILFETTATAAKCFEEHQDAFGTLRGSRFMSYRPTKKDNGRMQIAVKACADSMSDLPEAPDIVAVLEHMWRATLDIANPPDGRKESLKIVGDNGSNGKSNPDLEIVQQALTPALSAEEIRRRFHVV